MFKTSKDVYNGRRVKRSYNMNKILTKDSVKKIFTVKTWKYILPILHFICTFFTDRRIFIYENNFDFVNEIAKNNYISDKAELVIVYILSKVCAGIFIWFLWKFIFKVLLGEIKKTHLILFGIIFAIGLVFMVIIYPDFPAGGIDNYTTYAQAIRFLPTYWQSIYTGVIYAASLMLLPHSFGIYFFQWLAFVMTIAYIYIGLEKLFPKKNIKYFALLFFVLPESYYIVFDAYRNNYYTILCMFYFAYLIFSIREKNKQFPIREMVFMTFLTTFIMVWRSEGILIGIGGIILLLVAYKVNWKKAVILLTVFVSMYLALSWIQGIGEKKYYGQDYMIVNTCDVLENILNNPNADLFYEGAEEDLLAIEMVVPVQVLKEDGLIGYRNYNYTNGRPNFNQSLASDEMASAYMSAYYRIILHNLQWYLDVQINSFSQALQLGITHPSYHYTDEKLVELESFQYTRWVVGKEEFTSGRLKQAWIQSDFRNKALPVVNWIRNVWTEMWTATGVSQTLHGGYILLVLFLFVAESIKAILYKEKQNWEYLVYFLIILGETAAVFFFMPIGRSAYFYPVLYVSYLVILLYFAEKFLRKDRKSELNEE